MLRTLAAFALVSLLPHPGLADPLACLKASGKAGAKCLGRYAGAVEKCRRKGAAGCEDALRAAGGALEQDLAALDAPIGKRCDAESAFPLGYTSAGDVPLRVREACQDFAEDHLLLAFASDPAALSADEVTCQDQAARQLAKLRKRAVKAFGKRCFLASFRGRDCKREGRDERLARWRAKARGAIEKKCGVGFDALGLGSLDEVLATVETRARHYALRVYPPNDLGPTADFGPFPIGVTTIPLTDPSRPDLNDASDPRPVNVEIYYPSTAAAVAGVPGDVVNVLGIDIVETPAFRDVAIAPGPFPFVLFSHGNGGVRFQSFFFAAHLASHGFVVVTPDHHGNNFLEAVGDPDAAVNRPLDLSFLIDTFVAFNEEAGNFFEGAIDPDAIGASGHSFGGYTVFALAGGDFALGNFHDPRVKAILPQAPAAGLFDAAFFAGIGVPVLIVGGTIDETTPFATNQQAPFDALSPGATLVALAELAQAGHFTFSDFCEVPRSLLTFLGGFEEACEPRHLPWRHAHDLVNHLSLNFFRAVLQGDPEALARLAPAALAGIEGLAWQSK